MSAAEGRRLLTEPLVVNSHNTQVEVPAEKLAMLNANSSGIKGPINLKKYTFRFFCIYIISNQNKYELY